MAEFEIKAGAKLDLLTKAEVNDILAGWRKELARGVKFRHFSLAGVVAGGVWTIGAAGQDRIGPDVGMVWAVSRIAVSGTGLTVGTDLYAVHVNDVSPSTLVVNGLTRGNQFGPPLILNGGDQLVVTGAGTGGGTAVTVSGWAVELPVQLSWQLI